MVEEEKVEMAKSAEAIETESQTEKKKDTIGKDVKAKDIDMELPTLDLEEYKIPEAEIEEIIDESNGSVKFAFIGSGQCGSRICESFYNLGYKKAVVLNTTPHDLKFINLPENQKFFLNIGPQGAGKDMKRGATAVLQYQQEVFDLIRRIFAENVDHIFITFGAGGGSGSGSLLPLIEIAKKYLKYIGVENPNKKVGVLFTLPTDGEASSPLVAKNAFAVMDLLAALAHKNDISPVIVIDNNKIKKQYRGLTVKEFWPKINNTVAGLFHIFNLLSAQDSPYTSFDPVDYRSILQAGGFLIMGLTAVAAYEQEQDISKAIKNNLKKTLLAEEFDLNTAKVAASIAVGGNKMMAEAKGLMDNLSYGFDSLSNLCTNATLHRGIYQDLKESLRIYTAIGGLRAPDKRIARLKG